MKSHDNKALRPTAIIGVSGVPSAFSREVIEAMAAMNERPIVFALSNPTSESECTAEEAYGWTGGRPLNRIRDVSARIAEAVATTAYDGGLARRPRPARLMDAIRAAMFEPEYSETMPA